MSHRKTDLGIHPAILGHIRPQGLARMLFPIWLAGIAATLSHRIEEGGVGSTGLIVGETVVFLVIGAFLSYKAYMSS